MAQRKRGETDENDTTPPATVRQQEYSGGEGFEAGQKAPHTVYVNRDRDKVSTDEFPEGGWVLVTEGSTVTPDVAEQYKDLSD